jgi:hypothetical protein
MASSLGSRYVEAIARVTPALGVPFGYTLTVWSSGALATHSFGVPGPASVVTFVGGAVAVYLGFGAIGYASARPVQAVRARREVLFNAIPVVAAGVVTALDVAVDDPLLGWFLSGSVATALYIALLALVYTWGAGRSSAVDQEASDVSRRAPGPKST